MMVLCCVGHSLLLAFGIAGLASAAGAATGSIAVVAAIALVGLVLQPHFIGCASSGVVAAACAGLVSAAPA